MELPQKTSAENLAQYVPGTLIAAGQGVAWTDVFFEIYARRRVEESIIVPAVAEPLIVWVVSGSALVEEREFGGEWSGCQVKTDDFFLTTSATPYELRWRAQGADPFVTSHTYISLPTFARALKDVHGHEAELTSLREVFGESDPTIIAFLNQLRLELTERRSTSPTFVQGVAQSLAVHLVRTYPDDSAPSSFRRGQLPAYKLRRITNLLEVNIDKEFNLAALAEEAGMSEFHFSRVFKRTTGFSPLQYLTRQRIALARQLLCETDKSMIEIALEIGYSSPSHFAQIFRREVGITPSEYRSQT